MQAKSLLGLTMLCAVLAACRSGDDVLEDGEATTTYATSSNVGDFATWTLGGSSFSALWIVTDRNGATRFTRRFTGTCAEADTQFAFRPCTVETSVVDAGSEPGSAIAGGDNLEIMELKDIAVVVRPPQRASDGSRSDSDEVMIGFARGACGSDASGDYVFARTAAPGPATDTEALGVYNLNADLSAITHADFAFGVSGGNLNSRYATGGGSGNGIESPSNRSCSDGVFSFNLGTRAVRANVSGNGMLVLDLPSGSGGILALRTTAAASLADIQGKTFTGISYDVNPGGSSCTSRGTCSEWLRVSFPASADADGGVPFASFETNRGGTTPSGKFFSDDAGPFSATGFGAATLGTNPLAARFNALAALPGLHYFSSASSAVPAPIVAFIGNVAGKTVILGTTVGRVSATDEARLFNRGNFIVFQR